jgi:hypothetical protein
MGSVTAVRNGPGILVSWPHRPDATSFHLALARHPSPSWYDVSATAVPGSISGQHFPLLPTFKRPCCPVRPGATSLQIEGLAFGAQYKFKVTADAASNATLGESDWVRVAAVPGPPGKPHLQRRTPHAGAIYNVGWDPPADDHGDLVRGYRLHARIHSLNTSMLVLVANTSVDRPLIESFQAARASHPRLPLLPSHRYSLYVQAFNAVGGGSFSEALEIDAPISPYAEFELPLDEWRRGQVGRGAITRHRVFVPPGSLSIRIVVQQVAGVRCCSSLRERQLQVERRALRLYARAGGDAPNVPTIPPGKTHPDLYREAPTVILNDGIPHGNLDGLDILGKGGLVNHTAVGGELSLLLIEPVSRWVHVLVQAADVEEDGANYDVRVETDLAEGNGDRFDSLNGLRDVAECRTWPCPAALPSDHHGSADGSRWRYRVDPDGISSHDNWVRQRHLHPHSSGDVDMEAGRPRDETVHAI